MSYCLKSKKKTESKNISYVKSKNNRVIQKGTCSVCGSKKSEFPKHKRGYSFCGPGTNLNKRLDEADNPKPWSKPINWVDEVSMRHNIDYGNSTRLEEKHEAKREMLYNLSLIQNPTLR